MMDSRYRLSGQKIMITGASGFLGSHLCRRLVEEGAEVHAVSRSRRSDTGDLRWWQGNLADIASARSLLGAVRPDIIFHLAGVSTARPDLELVLPTFHSLLVSTVNLLTVAAEISGCRVVLAASLNEPQGNDAIPASPYAAAKWAGTVYGRMFHRLYDVPVVLVRVFMTFGPRQDIRKLVPYVIHSLLRGEAPKLSSGQYEADWIYVDDVIEGFLAAAHTSDIEGSVIDLGSGVLVHVPRLVELIIKLVGTEIEPVFGALPDRPPVHPCFADTATAYAKLRWKPLVSLEGGLAKTVEWYRSRLEIRQ